MKFNKAAMFGLDARIALAIFGALSVISGAALYSAIKKSKTEQWRQYFVEHVKASDAYYLDNSQEIPEFTGNTDDYTYAADLVENRQNLTTWKGPYIEGKTSSVGSHAIQDSFTNKIGSGVHFRLFLRQSSTWTEMNDVTTDEICIINNPDCAEWHDIYGHLSDGTAIQALFNDLDNLVDNGDGKLAGSVRFNSIGPGAVMYKGRARKRVN